MMDKRETIEYLKDRLSDIPKLAKLHYDNDEYPLWRNTIAGILEEVFGRDSIEYQYFLPCNWQLPTIRFEIMESFHQDKYIKNLKCLNTAILSIIQKHETLGMEEQPAAIAEPPKAFIAHEGKTEALDKLKDFLDALGVEYLIAEIEPSNGRSVEGQVTHTYQPADFAIILATKGRVIDKKRGTHYMGMNVADELGRARVAFKNKVILLLQKGVQPHTNISEIVHERFTQQNMDMAFIKIAKELKNWGFLRSRKVEE